MTVFASVLSSFYNLAMPNIFENMWFVSLCFCYFYRPCAKACLVDRVSTDCFFASTHCSEMYQNVATCNLTLHIKHYTTFIKIHTQIYRHSTDQRRARAGPAGQAGLYLFQCFVNMSIYFHISQCL